MKEIISLFFVGLFLCCTSNVKKGVHSLTNSLTADSTIYSVDEVICNEDSLAQVIFKHGIKTIKEGELVSKPNIKFSSDYSENFSFTKYQLYFKKNNIEFIDTVYERRII